MKLNKILKMVLTILIIILISIISFAGIFIKDKNKYKNIVKDYKLGMDLSGSRMVEFKVSDSKKTINYDAEGKEIASDDTQTAVAKSEEKAVNREELLTKENFKKSREILEARLKTMGLDYYEIRIDEENGKIVLNIPENDNTDTVVGQLSYQGKFEIVDSKTNEVLITNDDLDYVKAGYGSNNTSATSSSIVVFVNIQFNKEGTQKFKDITNNYIETKTTKKVTDPETGEEKEEETTDKKEVSIKLDDTTLLSTHFDAEVSNGLLQLSLGSNASTDTEQIQDSLKRANNLAALINNGKMPLVYTATENQYIASEITSENILYFVYAFIGVAVVGIIYLIVRYKKNAIYAPIYLILHIAILLLIIRYTNVVLTTSGLVAIVVSYVLGYVAMLNRIKNYINIKDKKEAYKKSMMQTLLMLIPIFIIAIVFTFNSWQPIASFGTVMFWGTIVSLLYMI